MGWDALDRWGSDAVRVEPLTGGIANQVWSVRVNGQPAVGRLGTRSDADLAWETWRSPVLRHRPCSSSFRAGRVRGTYRAAPAKEAA